MSFPKMNYTDIYKLIETISDVAIKRSMFSMKPWKDPDLDGFPVGFYQKLWDIIVHNVSKFVHGIWNKPRDLSTIN